MHLENEFKDGVIWIYTPYLTYSLCPNLYGRWWASASIRLWWQCAHLHSNFRRISCYQYLFLLLWKLQCHQSRVKSQLLSGAQWSFLLQVLLSIKLLESCAMRTLRYNPMKQKPMPPQVMIMHPRSLQPSTISNWISFWKKTCQRELHAIGKHSLWPKPYSSFST